MASKFGVAGGIPERRVRPIWDAIDSSQFKNALRQLHTLLAKYPNSPYALALKALILERMGKSEEALSVCLRAKEQLYTNKSIFCDDLTLSTLQVVFQRLNKLDLATSCYEYACGIFPNNLELMIGLFNCYVREYSFVKQQQIAIKMYKIASEERFLLWAVCSIQLQVFCGDAGDKLLPFAEGLLKKHIASNNLHEPEALFVYISVLEQQAKYGVALEILGGTLGSVLMIKIDKLRLQGRLLARAGDYVAATHIFQQILELCPDDWDCFLNYISCLLEDDISLGYAGDHINSLKYADCKSSHLVVDVCDSRLSNASAFMQELQTKFRNDFLRCPYLANLEIERRKHLYGKGCVDKLMECLMQYFLRFGHLACFTSDVEAFLQVLPVDKKTQFLENLKKSYGHFPTATIKTLGNFITVFKLQELIGNIYSLPISGMDLLNSAVNMAKMYCRSLPLSKELVEQECMHGEELLCLICNVLVQLYWRTRRLGYLLEAIMILEFGLTIRRYIWQYKILLLHLYSHLGAFLSSYEWYNSLDVKNILLETVMPQILPQMLVSPLWNDLNDVLRNYLKFMDDHFRESADHTFLAYRHRNYSKVIEFVQFKEHLQHSSLYLVAKVEVPILQIKRSAENLEEAESILESLECGIHFLELSNEIESKSLTFNEDLRCRPWWTPTLHKNYLLEPFEGVAYPPKENMQVLKEEGESNIRNMIGKRALLPRLIYTSIDCVSSSIKASMGCMEDNSSVSDLKMFSELKTLLERYATFLGLPLNDAIEMVLSASSAEKSTEVLNPNVNDWLTFAVFMNVWNLRNEEQTEIEKCKSDGWEMVDSLLRKCIIESIPSTTLLSSSTGIKLPNLVHLITEPLAWQTLILQSCIRASIPFRKKKKKTATLVDLFSSPPLSGIRVSIESLSGLVNEVLGWVLQQLNEPEEEAMDALLVHLTSIGDDGDGKVLEVLESAGSWMEESEVGDRVSRVFKSWSRVDVARKMVTGQRKVLSEMRDICEMKLKCLEGMMRRISQS